MPKLVKPDGPVIQRFTLPNGKTIVGIRQDTFQRALEAVRTVAKKLSDSRRFSP